MGLMDFFKLSATKPSVKVLEECVPDVIISQNALVKMQLFIDNCTDEIGWLGTAIRQNNIIFIQDVFLFNQEVHAATTEITPEGLSTFAEELLKDPNGMEIWNNIKLWGHSHVNMGVGASGQDDAQMVTFREGGHDWFLRIIGNKKGDIRVDLYDYKNGIIFNDLKWEDQISQEEQNLYDQMMLIEQMIAKLQKDRVAYFEKEIKAEIALKVKKKTWATTQTTTGWGRNATRNTGNHTLVDTVGDEKKTTPLLYGAKSVIANEEDIKRFIDEDMVFEIGECDKIADVYPILKTYNISLIYADVVRIWEYCVEKANEELIKEVEWRSKANGAQSQHK